MLQRGDFVLVRGYRGRPLIRRVWDVYDDAVMIHGERNYLTHLCNPDLAEPWPVGFHWNEVYVADEALAERIKAGEATWEDAQPLTPVRQ